MGHIVHGGTHAHPFITAVDLKATRRTGAAADLLTRSTTLTDKNFWFNAPHFNPKARQQPRAPKRAIRPRSPRSIGGSRLRGPNGPAVVVPAAGSPAGFLTSASRRDLAAMWLKRGVCTRFESGVPSRLPSTDKEVLMTVIIGVDPHKQSHTAVAIESSTTPST